MPFLPRITVRRLAVSVLLGSVALAAAQGPIVTASLGLTSVPGNRHGPQASGGHAPAAVSTAKTDPRRSAVVLLRGPSIMDRLRAASEGQRVSAAAPVAANVAAWDAEMARGQADVVAAVTATGAQVISRYGASVNGLLVHATEPQLEALRVLSQVADVEPAPLLHLTLDHSVPYIGADALADDSGYDGTGSVVAVLDTGMDYTHADLGGPGDPAAYTAARADAESIDDLWQGEPLFPNAKVVGGWDFVGPRYNTPELCPPQDETTGRCTTTPEPDPDPIDLHIPGHGTHVGGIVAGLGTDDGAVYHGVAPGASLVALKIYGSPPGASVDETVDVVIDAIDWCTRVNLGLPVPGIAPDHVDVINMSLGEEFAQGSRLFDQAVASASDVGIVVVASAGNSGNRPFVLGAPSASPRVLSVASSTAPSDGFGAHFAWPDGSLDTVGSEGDGTVPFGQAGPLQRPLAWYGQGCAGDPAVQDVSGKAALVERGDCALVEKVLSAQSAGAVSVVMFSDDRPRIGLFGPSDGITITGVMVDRGPGLELRQRLTAGTPVTVTIDPARRVPDSSTADIVSSFSSRGPSKNGALKPDITAPGDHIFSARKSSGTGGVALSGTSMASPHVAGAAAVMAQRNRDEDLGLSATDLAALLMNYADPVVTESGPSTPGVGVSRQGAGRVDLLNAGKGGIVARAGDIASLAYGPVALLADGEHEIGVTLTNLGDSSVTLRPQPTFRRPEAEAALRVLSPDPIVLAAHATKIVSVTLAVDAAALPAWPFDDAATEISAGAVDGIELDGWLRFQAVDAGGAPVPDADAPALPFYALARRASSIDTRGAPPAGAADPAALTFVNHSFYAGRVNLFWLLGTDAAEGADLRELDIRSVGARFTDEGNLDLAVVAGEPLMLPGVTRHEVYLDIDDDDQADYRLRTGTERALAGEGSNDAMAVGVTPWNAQDDVPAGPETIRGRRPVDLDSRLTVISVPLDAVGLDGPAAVGVRVVHTGLTEDWLRDPTPDAAPDAGFYRFDPASVPWRPDAWSVSVEPHAAAPVALEATGAQGDQHLLAIYPSDDPAGEQAQIVPNDAPVKPDVYRAYLPTAVNLVRIKPPTAGERVHAAIDALAGVDRFRMTFDVIDAPNPNESVYRVYEFQANHGATVVARPKVAPGDQLQYIRVDAQGFYKAADGFWYCTSPAWFMFLRDELAARLHEHLPAAGWVDDGQGPGAGLEKFKAEDAASSMSWFATIPLDGGPPTSVSWVQGSLANPTHREVYAFREYGATDIIIQRPRGARNCP